MTTYENICLHTMNAAAMVASSDDFRPIITGVLVRIDGERTRAVATDSYRLVTAVNDLAHPSECWEEGPTMETPDTYLIPAKLILDAYKAGKGAAAGASLTIGPDPNGMFSGDCATIKVLTPKGVSVFTDRLVVGEFPRWRSLFGGKDDPTVSPNPVGFNPEYLADFGKIGKAIHARVKLDVKKADVPRMTFYGGENFKKPQGFGIRSAALSFAAILMPVRPYNGTETTWSGRELVEATV